MGFAYREEGKDKLAAKEFAIYNKLLKQEGEYIEIPEKSTSDDINKYITLGDSYFKEGKLDEAISEYKKALEIKPRDDILNKLSQVYREKRLAGKTEDKSVITDTAVADTKTLKIDSFADEKILDGMPGVIRSDKIIQEMSVDDLSITGDEYYDKGMLAEAIEEFKEVLEIDPDDAETCYNLGNAYVDKEMFDEAISAYKKVIELNPGFIDAYINLGTVYLDSGLTDDAIALYQQGAKLNPDDAYLCYYLGEAYCDKQRYKKAIIKFEKAVSINPMDAEIQYRLAETYYETEQFDLALEHMRSAEELGYPVDQEFIDNLEKKTR
jgi:tetratricopeptide (TPR) repeat protein